LMRAYSNCRFLNKIKSENHRSGVFIHDEVDGSRFIIKLSQHQV
jgi:hypothetical protein